MIVAVIAAYSLSRTASLARGWRTTRAACEKAMAQGAAHLSS